MKKINNRGQIDNNNLKKLSAYDIDLSTLLPFTINAITDNFFTLLNYDIEKRELILFNYSEYDLEEYFFNEINSANMTMNTDFNDNSNTNLDALINEKKQRKNDN